MKKTICEKHRKESEHSSICQKIMDSDLLELTDEEVVFSFRVATKLSVIHPAKYLTCSTMVEKLKLDGTWRGRDMSILKLYLFKYGQNDINEVCKECHENHLVKLKEKRENDELIKRSEDILKRMRGIK